MPKKLDEPSTFKIFDQDIDNETKIALSSSLALAVDTEAMGLIHGRDRLCLIQICDELDNCPENFNPFQEDFDFDDVGDACDGLSLNESQQKRKLIRITDILGRDIQEDDKEKIRLYIYDDGWVERKIEL